MEEPYILMYISFIAQLYQFGQHQLVNVQESQKDLNYRILEAFDNYYNILNNKTLLHYSDT